MDSLALGLVQNAAILLAVVVLYDLATSGVAPVRTRSGKMLGVGVGLGMMGIGVMAFSLELEPGLIFDTRSVLMGISGLFFGPVATAIAAVIGGAYRLALGGPGAWTGVAVFVACGGMGLAWRRMRRGDLEQIGFVELIGFGLTVQAVFLLLLLTLPDGRGPLVLSRIAPPVLLIFPLATAALGSILARRLRQATMSRRLVESEARYRSFFDNNHAVMLLVDPDDTRIVDANPAAAEFYGHSRERLRSMSIGDINALPEERIREEMARARARDRSVFQFRHQLADGSIRDVEVFSGPISVEGRSMLYSIVHDITDRIEAEQTLLERTRALELRNSALEAAANPIVITNLDGTIEWVNSAFTELTGYRRDEALEKNPRDLVKSGVHDRSFYEAMWQTILSGGVWRGELTNRKKDGTLYQEQQTITPVRSPEGDITHFVAVKSDLSPRLEMEARLAQAQKLETVGRLAGGIAHDFNNLLTVINGTIELTLTDLPADNPLRQDMEEIREAGERGARLTRQLLAFSRRQVLAAEDLDLNELIENLLRMLRRLLGENVDIDVRCSDEPALVRVDRGQMEQVITNLALNARDAMPRGGTLTMATDVVTLGPGHTALRHRHAPGRYVRLRVQDTGSGMSPDILEHVFEPFFTTKSVGEGTGLGLPTVYGIVTQSGGEVEVESVVGEGTVFEVHLPLATPGQADATFSKLAEADPRPGNSVLLVEDDPAILRLAVRVLERAGYHVVATEKASAALELARDRDEGFDLLFSDVVMPDMSGPELAAAIRDVHPDMRVLFASGYVEDVLRKQGVTSGENGHFVSKPYTIESLTRAVREALAT